MQAIVMNTLEKLNIDFSITSIFAGGCIPDIVSKIVITMHIYIYIYIYIYLYIYLLSI